MREEVKGNVLAVMLAAGLADEAMEVANLLRVLSNISNAAEHHHAGCAPGPMKRMPPELRVAILEGRAALARIQPLQETGNHHG